MSKNAAILDNYPVVSTGRIRIGGRANYKLTYSLHSNFAIGSIVYVKKKAERGIYERVCIKDVRYPKKMLDSLRRTQALDWIGPLYVDTLNALWNEGELISYSEATQLIKLYRGIQDNEPDQDGVRMGGSANYRLSYFMHYNFAIGSIVYVKAKAQRGIYERICIKKAQFPEQYLAGMRLTAAPQPVAPIYTDTLNGLWNEDELLSYSDATALIQAARLRQRQEIEEMEFV